jgi:hypothetical protein
LNFPKSKIKTHQAIGLITILEGEATEEKIDKELKILVREKWHFKVKQIHHQEFLVVFPDKGSLDTFAKLYEFQMSLYGLKGKIEKTKRDSKTSTLLHTIWIMVHGVPDLAREVEAVKEIIGLVAKPLAVDELSHIRNEPVRVQGRCRNLGAIRGSIEIFFSGMGNIIRFGVEGGVRELLKVGKWVHLISRSLTIKLIRTRINTTRKITLGRAWANLTGLEKNDKEVDSSHEESMEEDVEKMQDGDTRTYITIPLAAFHLAFGMVAMDQRDGPLMLVRKRVVLKE